MVETPNGFSAGLILERIRGLPDAQRQSVIASLRSPEEIHAEEACFHHKQLPLAGTPCFVKDTFDIAGLPTRASSRFLERVRPGPHPDSALAKKLRALGVSILGKTQMNEFAYGLDGANPHYGDCPHPFLPGHCSGGSSSGSAWVVAKGLVPLAFGTDTGGSIRVPAAFCGIVGLRIPPNDWSTDGCFPLSPTFDTVGWFTRTLPEMTRYTRHLLDLPQVPPQGTELRILNAVPDHPVLTPFVNRQFPQAKTCTDFNDSDQTEARLKAFSVLQSREAMEVHKNWIDQYAEEYDPKVRALILRARTWTDEEIEQAEAVEKNLQNQIQDLFRDADILLLPVSPFPAPPSPMTQTQRAGLLTHTALGSLCRLPILTLPVPGPDGSYGIQCLLPPDRWREVLSRLIA
ncbi:MAG: amidase [Verrucomicrobia bacterium]|nr:amidase [Verrucomicrobiota bacterium]